MPIKSNKRPALRAFSLVELVLCLGFLGVLVGAIALPQLYALRVEAEVEALHRVNAALDNLAAGLEVTEQRQAWFDAWGQEVQRSLPQVTIAAAWQGDHCLKVGIRWPFTPGMVAIGTKPRVNTVIRVLYFYL